MGIAGRWWLLGAVGVVALVKGWRPVVKGAIKGYMAARDGVLRLTDDTRSGLEGLYEEARADCHGALEASPAETTEVLLVTAPKRRRARRAPTPA